MAKVKRVRSKACDRCAKENSVLFRVRVAEGGSWVFVCPDCLGAVKPNNPHYRYGGTWKSHKRH